MASQKYTINWTDGSLKDPFTVSTKTTDKKSTSLAVIGSGTFEWGKEYQENMIHLLENFASNSKPPQNPTIGQIWFNSTDGFLKVFGADKKWADLKNRRIDSQSAPVGKFIPGDLWYDSSKGQLKVYLNEGLWSDPMSGAIQVARPVPVPAAAPTTPTPGAPITPTPLQPSVPTPVSTPAPSLAPSGGYVMPSHTIAYYGPDFVWGLDGANIQTNGRVAHPVPLRLKEAFAQITVTNEGVNGNTITKMINGTDAVHRDWDYEMSQSSVNVVIIGSFGLHESISDDPGFLSLIDWKLKLTSAAQTAQRYGKLVVFTSMHLISASMTSMVPYASAMAEVAQAVGAGYIDVLSYTTSKFSGSITSWLPDGMTPNQAGYDIIAQQIVAQYPATYQKLTSIEIPSAIPKPFGQDANLYPQLTFREEFDGTSLRSSVWNLGNWFDQAGTQPTGNYSVANGQLSIWAKQNNDGSWTSHNFTCTTDGTFYQKYGYFEIEAKLPNGAGVWPAFWMASHDDSSRPQITIMETWPSDTVDSYGDSNLHPRNYIATAINPTASTIGSRTILGSQYTSLANAPDLSSGFHKYGVRWDSTGIQFYFDGLPIGSKLLSNKMTYRMYLVLDLWIGGKAAAPNQTTPTVADRGLVINYVRAWALNDGLTVVSGTSVGSSVPTPVATPVATPTPTVPTPTVVPITQTFHVGMHAHRLFNGGDSEGGPSPEPSFNYGIIRDWDISKLHCASVWKSDNSIDFTIIRQVYDGHARHGAKVIKCFGTVPSWASKRPNEANASYPSFPGGKAGPANLDQYEDYCFRFISTLRSYLFAVEGWNEPYGTNTNPTDSSADNPQFTTMTGTELADVQKRLYLAAKRVDPSLIVISPAQSYLGTIPQLLQLRTSQNEPIWQFFDVLGAHLYNHTADGVAGPKIADRAGIIKGQMTQVGISKPIADTEHGWLGNGANYNNWVNASSDAKGKILYNTAKAAKDAGIIAVAYYGYDDELMGNPDTDQVVASWMGNAYKDWDTKYGSATPSPTAPTPVSGSVQPFGQSGSYVMTFSDEFNGGLDLTRWNDHIWYQASDPAINYTTQNGSLLIWPTPSFVNRTIDTDGKFSQTYGFFEIEAKLPIGKGCWPAFWLMHHNDADGNKARAEIDIMEAYSGGSTTGWADGNYHPNNYAVALHQANIDYTYHQQYTKKLTEVMSPIDLSAGFHKYGLKWESNGITFYFDGQPVGSKWLDTTSYFDQPMYILVDLWFGSSSGDPDASTPTGMSNAFEIRYVRAWQFGSAVTPAPTPVAPTPTPTPVAPTPTPVPTPSPTSSIIVDYYGDSTIWGVNGASGGRVAQPAPAVFASSSGYTTRNEGVSATNTTQLLNGTDGVHPDWNTQMTKTTATHIIINHGINDWQLSQSQYKANLQQLINVARSHGKKVILETPNPTFQTLSGGSAASDAEVANKAQYMRDVGFSMNVGVIDQFQMLTDYMTANGKVTRDLCPDGLHPTQAVYTLKGQYAATRFAVLK